MHDDICLKFIFQFYMSDLREFAYLTKYINYNFYYIKLYSINFYIWNIHKNLYNDLCVDTQNSTVMLMYDVSIYKKKIKN